MFFSKFYCNLISHCIIKFNIQNQQVDIHSIFHIPQKYLAFSVFKKIYILIASVHFDNDFFYVINKKSVIIKYRYINHVNPPLLSYIFRSVFGNSIVSNK